MKRTWTPKQEQFLRDNYTNSTQPEMAAALNKSVVAVKGKCKVLKLKLSNTERGKRAAEGRKEKRKDSDIAFDTFVADNYLTMPLKSICRNTGFTISKVYGSLKRQGLKVPDELTKARRGESAFQVDGIPFNKGKKQVEYMSEDAIQNCKKSQFSKGHKPHNAHEIGAEVTVAGYTRIKVAEPNKWIFKQILVYESQYGPLQEGLIVVFEDKNTQNFDINNLKAITRAEHAIRNHDIEKGAIAARDLHDTYIAGVLKRKTGLTNAEIPQDLIELKRAQLQVNRQLNKLNKNSKKQER
jgi:hypothetical protein